MSNRDFPSLKAWSAAMFRNAARERSTADGRPNTCVTPRIRVGCNMTSAKVSAVLRPILGSAIGSAVVLLASFCAYQQHLNRTRLPRFAGRPSCYSLVRLLASYPTSFAPVACLGYFFAPPILSFYFADPHKWVAPAVFELTELIGGQLSTHAAACRRIVVKEPRNRLQCLLSIRCRLPGDGECSAARQSPDFLPLRQRQ